MVSSLPFVCSSGYNGSFPGALGALGPNYTCLILANYLAYSLGGVGMEVAGS
jgi:hypothetical protein